MLLWTYRAVFRKFDREKSLSFNPNLFFSATGPKWSRFNKLLLGNGTTNYTNEWVLSCEEIQCRVYVYRYMVQLFSVVLSWKV